MRSSCPHHASNFQNLKSEGGLLVDASSALIQYHLQASCTTQHPCNLPIPIASPGQHLQSAALCSTLKTCWDDISMIEPKSGYHLNGAKTHLVAKPEHEESASQLYAETDIQVSISGKHHLGAAVGSWTFTEEYVSGKVKSWAQEITRLIEVATSQPHTAYAALAHGLSNHWSYISWTIPDIQDLLLPVENAIHQILIPVLTGRHPCSKQERGLVALPTRLGNPALFTVLEKVLP